MFLGDCGNIVMKDWRERETEKVICLAAVVWKDLGVGAEMWRRAKETKRRQLTRNRFVESSEVKDWFLYVKCGYGYFLWEWIIGSRKSSLNQTLLFSTRLGEIELFISGVHRKLWIMSLIMQYNGQRNKEGSAQDLVNVPSQHPTGGTLIIVNNFQT